MGAALLDGTDERLDSVPGIRRGSCAQITHITKNPVEKPKSTPNTLYCYVSVQAGHVYSYFKATSIHMLMNFIDVC